MSLNITFSVLNLSSWDILGQFNLDSLKEEYMVLTKHCMSNSKNHFIATMVGKGDGHIGPMEVAQFIVKTQCNLSLCLHNKQTNK